MRGIQSGILAFLCFILLATTTPFAFAASSKTSKSSCDLLLTSAVPLKWVKKMQRRADSVDAQTTRLRDAVQRVGFSNVALNQSIVRAHTEHYTTELAMGPMTNQKHSGRCWIFAGLNMMRSALIAERKAPTSFEFSENYLHFFNMLEKSNKYLEEVLETTRSDDFKDMPSLTELRRSLEPSLSDGGFYDYFMQLVAKYGVVPKEVMPETRSSENTNELRAELETHLGRIAEEVLGEYRRTALVAKKSGKKASSKQYTARLRAIKERGLAGIWEILTTHLGEPPSSFQYRIDIEAKAKGPVLKTKTVVFKFTPAEFAREFVKFDPNDYVIVAAFPLHKKDKVFERKESAIGPSRPGEKSYDVRFLNVSMERLEALTIKAIDGGQPVWFGADVSRDVDLKTGIMHPLIYEREGLYRFGKNEEMSELSLAKLAAYGLVGPNHAMLLTGYDKPNPNGPVLKFKNENSWGEAMGSDGVFHLYREWFHENVFEIVVHKRFLNKKELKLWEGPSTELNGHLF